LNVITVPDHWSSVGIITHELTRNPGPSRQSVGRPIAGMFAVAHKAVNDNLISPLATI